jgi:hypothetical protein
VIGAACASESDLADGGGRRRSHWELSVAYRKQRSHRHFVGTVEQTQRAAQHTEIVNDIHLFDIGVTYQYSPRLSLSASVPFMHASRTTPGRATATFALLQPTTVVHSDGFGDIAVGGKIWVLDPGREKPPRQNIAFGFGVKMPTGKPDVTDNQLTLGGSRVVVVDQSIQLGDGGWGFVASTDMFKRLGRGVTLYGSGVYLVNPRDTNGVKTGRSRPSEAVMSVSDQYLARAGVIFPVPKVRGWTASFGGRIEGVPVRDLIGKSDGFRRPGYAVALEPGVNYYRKGRDVWSLSVPVAVRRNRLRSVPDLLDGRAGDAAFADYTIVAGWSHRF